MDRWQDSLLRLGKEMFGSKAEPERLEKNFLFVKTLVSALKERYSFLYSFPKLDMISNLQAPNGRFRIFSWNIPLDDGSYLYYGAIQTKSQHGELQLVPLLDKTFEIIDPEYVNLKPSEWYGAQYYDIASLGDDYILLGWKGHTPQQMQKVIEILQFDGSSYQLGKAVFDDHVKSTRKIFRFARHIAMYLRLDADKKRIVFDHIVPADSTVIGSYDFYGPDLSYDAYTIENGNLVLQRNVSFQNTGLPDVHVDVKPGQAIKAKKSGL
ncbi:hypothetical protein GCM10017764_26210 [Sphingobacterium griseoflavum]|uniref:Uncharacterized protein n=2 Tax=Sphingobacterium griseoflavum TaxID=1474952 RepID=A0ABQ3HWK0_9SPHI|nr:hypothetical protein GCM10017764_26210 [Sphingobacterium griseoflavum]